MPALREPLRVFCSVAPEDEALCAQLYDHLRPLEQQHILDIWYPRVITAGTNWATEIDAQLANASIILLLISSSFFASDYCYGVEMRTALKQHEGNKVRIIPILLRPVDWKVAPFAHLAVLPDTGKPLTEWRNRDAALANIAAGIRRVIEELNRPLGQRSSVALCQVWNVPYLRNIHFTGRDELLEQLDQQLSPAGQADPAATRRAALTQPQAIKGLGGIGKTQIAVEYAYRSRDLGRYTHTLWVNAASKEVLITSFTELAELLPEFPAKDEVDQHKLMKEIKRWLEQCEQHWLLIFDNADDILIIQEYLPQWGNGSILITTRANAVGSLAASLEVETMGLMEGTYLLLRRAQRFGHVSDEEINEAGNIVVALDHFPLALDQAGAYIEESGLSFGDYLQVYQNRCKEVLARRGRQATNYPDSVATTWSLSFQKIEQGNPAAAELLRLLAFLAPDTIPEELIRDGMDYWSFLLQQAVINPFTLNKMFEDLLRFSLIKRLIATQTISIHRLVQIVQRDVMGPQVRYQWAERVIQAVNKVFPDNSKDIATWPLCLRYLDQVQICNILIEQYKLPLIEAADLLNRTGLYLDQHASYAIAEPLYQRALSIREKQSEPNFPAIAIILNNLAKLYCDQGKDTEAEPLLQRALLIQEQQVGPNHSDTSISLNNLGVLYWRRGKYAEAERMYQRALSIREKRLGPDHPDTATSLNNLAELYRDQGKDTEAEPLLQRALLITEKQLGPDHPNTAASLNNLAMLCSAQGKYAEAERMYQRALSIREKQLGPDHPDTATSLGNLAELYRDQGKDTEAEPLLQRALLITEKRLGPDHPDTATSLGNLAILYKAQGKYAEAEPLYQRALAINEQQLGAEHPNTAISLNNLAGLYRVQNKYVEAEPLLQRALLITEKQLGPDHPNTSISLNNLGVLYKAQGKYGQAELLYQRALSIREKRLGPNHPDTATSLNNLAKLYYDQGKYAEAEPLYQRALATCKQVGTEYLDIIPILSNLAEIYQKQEKYEQAERLYQNALIINENAFGPEHPNTATTLNKLGMLYYVQGKYGQAEPLWRRALTIFEQRSESGYFDTALIFNNLGMLYFKQNKYEQAEPLLRQALATWRQVLGLEHPLTARIFHNLGILYFKQNKYEQAEPLLQQGLAIRERVLGSEHPDTLATSEMYIDLLRVMKRPLE